MRRVLAKTLTAGDVCYYRTNGLQYKCSVLEVDKGGNWLYLRFIAPVPDYPRYPGGYIAGDQLVSVLDDARDALRHGTVRVTAITCPHCGYPLELSAHLEKWEKQS